MALPVIPLKQEYEKESADVLRTRYQPGLPDEARAIQHSLLEPIASPPLVSLVKSGDRVTVVHTDITRATPNDRVGTHLRSQRRACPMRGV